MSERFPGGFITKTPVVPSGPYETSSASGIWTLDQQQQAQKAGIWPLAGNPPPDPYFEYVTMLLHGDGTNGAQNNTFIDSSTNNFTITRSGNTTQGSFSPYGTLWSNYFGPNTDALAVSGLSSASGDFTVEGWFYFQQPSTNNDCTFFGPWQTGLLLFMVRYQFGQSPKRIEVNWGGSTILTGNPASSLIGVWSHIAITRASGTVRLFLNGTLLASTSNSATINFSTLLIGREQTTTTTDDKLVGYASNVRVSTTTAFYTSAFTPSTTPLTAISGTSLLTCQSNRFVDNSSNNFTISTAGSPSVQRFSPFAPTAAYSTATIGGSGYFDGSGDYLTAPDNAAFEFGSGNFTIEAWAYPLDGGFQMLIAKSPDNQATGWQFFASGDELNFYASTGGSWNVGFFSSGAPIKRNAWNHLAVTRNGSTWTIWVNGVSQATATSSITINNNTLPVAIGTFTNASYFSYGYTADVRIVKGTAVYTSNFTPPTAPLTAITNTSLLASFTNGAIFDNAMMNDLETVGNAQISTSVKKYGTGSISFDGANPWDYLVSQVSPNLGFGSGDFTIEGWGYVTSTGSTYQCMVSIGPPVQIYARSGTIEVYFSDVDGTGSYIVNGMTGPASSVSANTWFHFAVVRNGTTFTAYVNGVAGTPVTGVSAAVALSATPFALGTYGPAPTTYPLTGYIDDFRITKGYARYTANFTPPTAAFPNY